MEIFAQQLVNGLVLGSIYALVALGYTMVYGILGLINFAHGDITMIGALVALTVMTLFIPCVANFLVIAKERGTREAVAVLVLTTTIAVATGMVVRAVLAAAGWS